MEAGATERCRITQEQQVQRSNRWAAVADVCVAAQKEVKVEAETTKREAIAASERIEGQRLKANKWQLNVVHKALVAWVGVSLVRELGRHGVRTASKSFRRFGQLPL